MVSKRNVCKKVRGLVSSIPMNPQKRKEDARRFAKKETLARPSPTFFPLPQIFLFFFLLEGETKGKAQGDDEETNQKIPSSKGVCMSILLLCHILLPLIKKRVVCVIFFDFTRFSLASLSSKLLTDIVVFFALVARASFVQRHRDTTR